MPDILVEAARRAGRQVVFEMEERKRAEQRIYRGQADGLILTREWAEKPNSLIFSKPFFIHQAFLLSKTSFDAGEGIAQWLAGKTVCTRVNYVYPLLDEFFAREEAFRLDLSQFFVVS